MEVQLSTILSDSGDPIFAINDINIQDKHDPREKVKKELNNVVIKKATSVFIIFGLDYGYTAEAIRDKYPKSQIFIYEPSIEIFEEVMKHKERWAIITDKVNPVYATTLLQELETSFYDTCNRKTVAQIINIGTWAKIFKPQFDEFLIKIKKIILVKTLSEVTKDIRYKKWTEFFIHNLIHYYKSPHPRKLYNRFRGVPAVICSAGPSLTKQLKHLKKVQDNFIIISVNTTQSAVSNAGADPHIMTTVESADITPMIQDTKISNTTIVAPLIVYPPIMKKGFLQSIYFAHMPSFYQDFLLKDLHEDLFMDVGGSVACTATTIAILMGCNPIILIGQDLAFTDNQVYSSATKYGNSKLTIDKKNKKLTMDTKKDIMVANKEFYGKGNKNPVKTEDDLRYIDGYYGDTVLTYSHFIFFLTWFENLAQSMSRKSPEVRLINSTEGGANIKGFENIPFEDVIEEYKHTPPHKAIPFLKNMEPHKQENLETYKNILLDMKKTIYQETDIVTLQEKLPLFKSFSRKLKDDYKQTKEIAIPEFLQLINITLSLLEDTDN